MPALTPGYPRFTLGDPDLYEDYVTIENTSAAGISMPIRTVFTTLLPEVVEGFNTDGGGTRPPDGFWEYSPHNHDGTESIDDILDPGEKITKLWQLADEGGEVFNFWVDAYSGCPGVVESGLQLWLVADDLAGADGTEVTTWSDRSENGNDVSQTTQAQKPLLYNNVLNSHTVVRFDGANDALIKGPDDGTTYNQFTIFLVMKLDAGATAPSPYYPFNMGAEYSPGTVQDFGIETRNSPSGSSKDRIDIYGEWSNDAVATLTDIANFGEWKLLCIRINGNIHNTQIWESGTPAAMSATGANNALAVRLAFGIGGHYARYGENRYYGKCDFAEILLYTTVLPDVDRLEVEEYLGDKYGFSLD